AVAAMALKRGYATMRTRMLIPCRGGLQYGDRFFRCWNAEGHGSLTLEQAIAQSCDVYFYQLGLKLGLTSLLEDGHAWGFRGRVWIGRVRSPLSFRVVRNISTGCTARAAGPRR